MNTKSGISKASRTENQTSSVQNADMEHEQSEDEGLAEGQEDEQGEEQEEFGEQSSEPKKRKRAKDIMYFPYQAQPTRANESRNRGICSTSCLDKEERRSWVYMVHVSCRSRKILISY